MLNPSEKSRLKWACRRGMLELDVIFMPFFEHEFDGSARPNSAPSSACWSARIPSCSAGAWVTACPRIPILPP
jgi:hypothetical protein